MKIEGSRPHKQFRVHRNLAGSDVLASFDTLAEAIADVGKRRSDWRYVIRDRWTIVWPKPKG
jgi:hypothetical protein